MKLIDAYNQKLSWDLFNFVISSTTLLRQIFLRKGDIIKYHISYSLWSNLKAELATVDDISSWYLGNGDSISLWFDNWCGTLLHINMDDPFSIVDQKVSNIVDNGRWDFLKSSIHSFLYSLVDSLLSYSF